jgi:MFS family permease
MSLLCKELVYALVLLLGSINFGYVIAYPSPAIPDMRSKWEGQVSETEFTFFNSASALFAIAGPFSCNLILKYFGRRPTTCIIAVFAAATWFLIMATSPKLIWLGIFFRALSGIGMGAFSSIIPLYIVELAPKEYSGFFGSMNQLGVATGICICYLVGNWASWSITALVGGLICTALAILVWFIPESPALSELNQDQEEVQKESIFQKKYLRSLLIGAGLMFFQQFSGVNGILTNLSDLFTDAGINIKPGIASTIASSAQIIAVLVGGLLMDFFGRKKLWIISSSGLIIALAIYAITLKTETSPVVPIIAIFIFMLAFGAGSGPIPWFIIPEIFPTSVRATAQSICSSINWIFAFIVIFIFKLLIKWLTNFGAMIFFCCICVGSVIFGFLCITEPRGEYNIVE